MQNFGPKTAQKLGIGAERMRARNPRLVYCAMSGFGQSGPLRDRLAMDSIIQAHSGIMSVTGEPDGEPTAVGAPIADVDLGNVCRVLDRVLAHGGTSHAASA